MLFQWETGYFRHPNWVPDICWILPVTVIEHVRGFWFPDDVLVDCFALNWFDKPVAVSNLHDF